MHTELDNELIMFVYKQYVYHESNLHINVYRDSRHIGFVGGHAYLNLRFCNLIGNGNGEQPQYRVFGNYT